MEVDIQGYLDSVWDQDKHGFLKGIDNWCNHRPMLLLALNVTEGPVFEFGSGDGSTKYLSNFCEEKKRQFSCYDSNKEWANKCGAHYIPDWNYAKDIWSKCGLAFVDHAPGEHRHEAIAMLSDKADVIVVHDSEVGGAGNYQLDKIWHMFKYRLNYNKTGGGAGTTALSNKIDLHQFAGHSLGGFKFES